MKSSVCEQVNRDLRSIDNRLQKLSNDVGNAPEGANRDALVRECFREVQKACKKTLARFPSNVLPDAAVASANRAPNVATKLADFVDALGDLGWEIKRFHHDRAANQEVLAYAKREADKIRALNPGLAEKRPLSELKTGFECGVGWRTGFAAKIANIGPMASYKFLFEKRIYVDEDGKLVLTDSCFHTARVGLAARIGKMFGDDGEGLTAINLYGGGRIFVATGDYHKYDNLESLFISELARKGDRWQGIFRSGNPDSPGTKYAVKAQRGAIRLAEKLGGTQFAFDPGTPMVSMNKMKKGSHNADRIHKLVARLTTPVPGAQPGSGSRSLLDITVDAYPETSQLLQARSKLPLNAETVASKPYNALNVSRPLPAPANAFPSRSRDSISRKGGGGEIAAGVNSLNWVDQGRGRMHLVAGANASYEYAKHEIAVMRLGASHAQLDPKMTKDIRISEGLLLKLKSIDNGKPKLHSLGQIERVLKAADDSAAAGGVPAVPRMRGEDNALRLLEKQYHELVYLGGALSGMKEKARRKDLIENGETSVEKRFTRFIDSVLGINAETLKDPAIAKFKKQLLADPSFFIAESFDALSVSLGQVGVHMFHTKKTAHNDVSESLAKSVGIPDQQKNVDLLYRSLRTMIEEVNMPIDRETLLRTASVRNIAFSASTTNTWSFEALAGTYISPLQHISFNQYDATSVPKKDSDPSGRVMSTSVSASVGFSVWSQVRDFLSHAIPIRHGKLYQVKVVTKGAGLTAPTLAHIMGASLENLQRSHIAPNKKIEEKMSKVKPKGAKGLGSLFRDVVTAFAQSAFTEGTAEREYFVEDFKRHDQGDLKYELSRQNVRYSMRKGSGSILIAGVAFCVGPVPMAAWGSVGYSTSSSNVTCEILGSCPAYHALVHHQLRGLMSRCPSKPAASALVATGIPVPCDLKALRELFLSGVAQNKAMGELQKGGIKPPEKAVDAEAKKELAKKKAAADQMNYQLVRFFGSPDAIIGPLKKYVDYLPSQRQFGGPIVHTGRERSEYNKWEDNQDMWETLQTMNEADRFAPGVPPPKGPRGTSKSDLDPRPKLSQVEIDAIKEVHRHMCSTVGINLGAPERAAYFLDDRPGMPGPIAFAAYCKIMAQYEKINDAAKTHHSYAPYVAG